MKIYSNKILRIAKSWLGTRFSYYGRVKIDNKNKCGVDSEIGIIHCCIEARCIVEQALDNYWLDKVVAYYRYPKN